RFLDRTHGWAVQRTGSASRLFHTRDGQNWIVAGTIGAHHSDYAFTSDTAGVLLEGDQVKTTADGGRTWKPVFSCKTKIQVDGLFRNINCQWHRLQFVSPTVGWAVAKSYEAPKHVLLAKTTDGGATWNLNVAQLTSSPADVF